MTAETVAGHHDAANTGFHLAMRTDLMIAMALGGVAAVLAVAGFSLFEWSPIVVGLLFALMVAADGYLVLGLMRQAKKPPAS